jgi:hypothetical protein
MRLRAPFLALPLALALLGSVSLPSAAQAAAKHPAQNRTIAHSNAAAAPRDQWWCGPGNPGYFCDHQDPYSTSCATTGAVWYVASGNVVISGRTWQSQLYYSTSCRTMWARLQLISSGSNACAGCVLTVVRHNSIYSIYDTDSVGTTTSTIYNGAYTDQLYLPCGGSVVGNSETYFQFNNPATARSNNWYPGC